MINARSFVISIFGAALSAAPLIYAQDVKPPPGTETLTLSIRTLPIVTPAILTRPLVIQQLPLQPQPFLGVSLQADSVSASLIHVQDLSRYREFQFGMNLLAVAKQADMKPSQARVIHQRPALIQELEWRPSCPLAPSPQSDSVREVLFSFYNGELFRILVNYDQYQTEGLTDEDMVEAISARYGRATKPTAKIVLFSSFQVNNDTEKVIARWEDSQYSFNLFRSSYQPTFGMLVLSKRLDPLAQVAIVEAVRLDELEAPRREMELQKRQDEKDQAEQAKARAVNKVTFRP